MIEAKVLVWKPGLACHLVLPVSNGHIVAIYGFNNGDDIWGGPPSKLALRRKFVLRW